MLFGGQRRDFGLFEGVEDVVNEEAGLGGGIVAQTREATGGIGGAGTGGSRYVGLAGTMGPVSYTHLTLPTNSRV